MKKKIIIDNTTMQTYLLMTEFTNVDLFIAMRYMFMYAVTETESRLTQNKTTCKKYKLL